MLAKLRFTRAECQGPVSTGRSPAYTNRPSRHTNMAWREKHHQTLHCLLILLSKL